MSQALFDKLKQHLKLSDEKLKSAHEISLGNKISLFQALEQMKAAPINDLLDFFAKAYGVQKINIAEKIIPRQITELIPGETALKLKVIPIDKMGNNLFVAMVDPKDLKKIDEIRYSTGFFPKPVLASTEGIEKSLQKYYASGLSVAKLKKEAAKGEVVRDNRKEILGIEGDDDEGPIKEIVHQVLIKCLETGASDIHFEPYEDFTRIRLRIDGSLREIARPPIGAKAALISRIKIMANLNIAEGRLPQDGAINIKIGGKPVDFRVNTLPTIYGEKIVMRILDKSNLQVDMTQLGFEEDDLEKFQTSIHNPLGMVLVTGPTGSGKTTTLYSALAELNKESENIMTAEDPVEYNLPGINQVHVKPQIGLTFAEALRAFLRQDPDVVMVGEIRDLETANIAIKAALTGHLVLSTLHTNSATDTISRMLNMGVESFNLVSALICVTAQRLLKKNCRECLIVDEAITPKILTELGVPRQYLDKVKAYKGKGCPKCNHNGTKGRVAVHEVLKLSDPVRDAIIRGEPSMVLKRIAMAHGMHTLRQSALIKLAKGEVSATEVIRVTSSDTLEDDKSQAA